MRPMRHLRIPLLLTCSAALAYAWSALPPQLTRGPYLQSLDATGTQLVFRAASDSAAVVRLGLKPGPPWELEFASPSAQTHVVSLSGLMPETLYHYEVELGGSVVTQPEECFFRTAPPAASRRPFRFLAWGDSGTGNVLQLEVAQRMREVFPWPDFALGLGDLVYPNGEAANFDPRFFEPYAHILPSVTAWVTIGNHDASTQGGAPFLEAFHMPTGSGAPGHPSNTELYYSFDYGMAHFVCVDTQVSSNNVGGTMYRWIQDDLDDANARGKRWKVVFMHHPPYTKGTHDSDVDAQLIAVRQNLVPLFESRGVDLVLAGHSHVYERSYLAQSDAVLQADAGTYTKYGTPDGAIYLVNGCGGQSGSGPLNHPLMARSLGNVEGVNVIDVDHARIQGLFVQRNGTITDVFTLRKAVDATPPRIAGLRVTGSNELKLTWEEPVLGGSGTYGAETPSNYSITPSVGVLSASLESDQRTVRLGLASAAADQACELDVLRAEDRSGNRGDATAHFVTPSAGPGSPPVAVLEVDREVANVPARLRFDARDSLDPDGTLVGGSWDFGDGTSATGGSVVEHLYDREGTFTATLTVRDSSGKEAIATRSIRIHGVGQRPQVSLVASSSAIQRGESIDFDAGGCFDPDGGPVYVHWDFGDPGSGLDNGSNQLAHSHLFASAGAHVVTLTVMDDEGSVEVGTLTVQVDGPPPGSSSGGCSGSLGSPAPWEGDHSFVLALALVFLVLGRAARRGARRSALAA